MKKEIALRGELLEAHPLARLERLVLRQTAGGSWREVMVRVREGRVFIDGEPLPAAHHTTGYAIPTPDGRARLCLTDADHRIETELEVASPERAQELLDALGLAPDRLAVPFVGVWVSGIVIGFALFIFAISLALSVFAISWLNLIPASVLLVLAALILRASRHPFVVAPDGIIVQRFGHRRAVSYRAVDRVETDGDSGLRVHQTDGTTIYVDFPVRVPSLPHPVQAPLPASREAKMNLNELVASLIEAQLAHRDDDDAPLAAQLARGGRTTDRWLDDLRRLDHPDYRGLAPHRDQLWRVIEDGAADPSARAAAASLLTTADEADRKRLRIAAESVATPRLRMALQALAESEEAEREAALAIMEAEDAGPSRDHRASPDPR